MQKTMPDLAALIGSRICHDLISPIGAIDNGLELLGMAGDTSGPELTLIGESVENAAARIRFFRLAFGAASAQDLSVTEIRSVLADVTRNSKINVEWSSDLSVSRTDARLAFLAQQCLETAMPYGGDIVIARDADGWIVTGTSEKFNVDEALWSILAQGSVPMDLAPAHVQFALLAVHTRDLGRALHCDVGSTAITIRF